MMAFSPMLGRRRLFWLAAVLLLVGVIALGLYVEQPEPRSEPFSGPLRIRATRLPLEAGRPARNMLGRLRFLDAWSLEADNVNFGGISSMIVGDGRVTALNDTGQLIGFNLPPRLDRSFLSPLPVASRENKLAPAYWDSESMVHDPVSGRYWVGFELKNQLCRYAPGFARREACVRSPDFRDWPVTEGMEAMTRLPDGRFILFSEGQPGKRDGLDVLLFAGDPVEATTPRPRHLNYLPPPGYRPTDAVWIGRNRLLVINRRVTVLDGFTAVLALVDISRVDRDDFLRPVEIARFAPPVLSDNFEALAVEKRGRTTLLWIASDDNHEFFQRSLLMKFALPPDLSLP